MVDYLKVQRRLKELGFDPGPLDGIRGPRTDAAVTAFKSSIGLRARPYIGPITEAALFKAGESAEASDLPWMNAAQAVRGLHEQRDTARLKAWFDKSVSWIDPREISWCGAFVATCHRIANPDVAIPENPLGARNWGRFGRRVSPCFGATMTFWRISPSSWQGHVGFYVGEDGTHFHVLGGNQSNAVTVSRVAKSRLLESRWPSSVPVTGKRIILTAGGAPVTTNEA